MSCRTIPTSLSSSAFISDTFYTLSHVEFSPELRNVTVTLGEHGNKHQGQDGPAHHKIILEINKTNQTLSETSNRSKTQLHLHIYKWKEPASLVKLFWLRLVLAPAL